PPRRPANRAAAAAVGRHDTVRRLAYRLTRTGGDVMTSPTHKDVMTMLGPLDDAVVAGIIATGATVEELAQARAWLTNDEALINSGKPLPSGRVADIIEIMAAQEQEEDELARS